MATTTTASGELDGNVSDAVSASGGQASSISSQGGGGAAGSIATGGTAGVMVTSGTAGAMVTGGTAGSIGTGGVDGGAKGGNTGRVDAAVDGPRANGGAADAAGDGSQPDSSVAVDTKLACGTVCDIYCRFGNVPDESGCPTCACAADPSLSCREIVFHGMCDASAKCRWLAPGCGASGIALPVAGCLDRTAIGCTTSGDCSNGKNCVPRVISPCGEVACPASSSCGETMNVCL